MNLALAAANRAAYALIMTNVAGAITGTFGATVADASDASMAAWASRYAGIVSGGQRIAASQSSRAAWRYLGASHALPGVPPAVAVPPVLASDAWASSPILRLRKHLAEGMAWEDAKAAAGIYAGDLSTGDIANAAKHGAEHAGAAFTKATGFRVAWAKHPPAKACDWCQLVSSQLYKSATKMPAHLSDKCGFVPVSENDPDATDYTNARTIFRKVTYARGR